MNIHTEAASESSHWEWDTWITVINCQIEHNSILDFHNHMLIMVIRYFVSMLFVSIYTGSVSLHLPPSKRINICITCVYSSIFPINLLSCRPMYWVTNTSLSIRILPWVVNIHEIGSHSKVVTNARCSHGMSYHNNRLHFDMSIRLYIEYIFFYYSYWCSHTFRMHRWKS